MWTYIHADELRHYGVKGMKWGVRRSIGKKARLYDKTSAYSKVNKKAIGRLERIEKRTGYLSPRQQEKMKKLNAFQSKLDKAMNTLAKDISQKDINQAKVDNFMRRFGAYAVGGHIGGLVVNTKDATAVMKLLERT